MKEYKNCYECDGKMVPTVVEKTFHYNGKDVVLKGLKAYVCEKCGSVVYLAEEAEMIDRLVRAINSIPAVDILNLEETAELLRVSNQTVYNMIRSGRIKAYKAGREWRFLRSDIAAYLNNSSNISNMKIAAKGGQITEHDKKIILNEIEQRKKENDD